MKKYYLVTFAYDTVRRVAIWYTNEVDGFMTVDSAPIAFRNMIGAKAFCSMHSIVFEDDFATFDVHILGKWADGQGAAVDSEKILAFWNIASDYARSSGISFIGDSDDYRNTYEKLFFGNNLPSINTSGNVYTPDWTGSELISMRTVVGEGVEIMKWMEKGNTDMFEDMEEFVDFVARGGEVEFCHKDKEYAITHGPNVICFVEKNTAIDVSVSCIDALIELKVDGTRLGDIITEIKPSFRSF